ncbi:MAG: LysM peptidoglycan-binding domain-containing protein [Chloroflexi bacterium]|nr:LysM peptidoglycan-binding domain-containing protein [Chloroflexota bacterium]MCI0575339.1 LysM peptidoglycan-binding domain-containing protein [Chloroflexota bacterium]MCI0646087.1 LysM peptidoglycan-binding domain-containing protein [Chloroflexota bacterium]MCI0730975.1 LysM peptidoglycan-binding domain-containing protein [Chloroflexota bacterium]
MFFEQFPITSRYHNVEKATIEMPDGTTIAYLRRRFVPSPDRFSLIQEHIVGSGDRLDNITAHYLGDPEQFWRIADANNAIKPEELTAEIGRKLRITQPEGLTG